MEIDEESLDKLEKTMIEKAHNQADRGNYQPLATITQGLLNIALYRRVKAGGGVKVGMDGSLGMPEPKGLDVP